jgi:hypothetical protein
MCMVLAVGGALPLSAQDAGTLDELTGENQRPLQVSGFGVAGLRVDGRTGDNGFEAGKLALGVFRELNERVWIFGQLTTSVESAAGTAGDPKTNVEIDNLIVNLAPAGSRLSFAIGKFDTPLGFERDDEPLNLQPSTSNNFELARPAKMVGVIGRAFLTSSVDVSAWVANGWDGDLASTRGKTIGGRLGIRPSERTSFGAGFLYGPEREGDSDHARYLTTLDYAMQPTGRWIIGGEANWGGDRGTSANPAARWYGATATVFRQLADTFGLTARAERFSDPDGARTGTPQSISSIAIAPIYFVGAGGEGIFATIEHTTFRIPRFQVRGEARFDRSTAAVCDTRDGLSQWGVEYRIQLVATF